MLILPAIDLYEGKAVRLLQGDYSKMTVYSDDPVSVARGFRAAGAEYIHVVDLEGAREGAIRNFDTIRRIALETGLKIQSGGGIRDHETIEKYLESGVSRVILGTTAITKPHFVTEAAREFGDKIAVAVDIRDGLVAIRGWTELSDKDALFFCRAVEDLGVKTVICTDISKDGVLAGTNMQLYSTIRKSLKINIIASGGITALNEIKVLSSIGMNGAILGKALYTGDIELADAISAAKPV